MKSVKNLLFLLTAVISISFYPDFLSSEPLDIEPSETISTFEMSKPLEITITDSEDDGTIEFFFIAEEGIAPESTEPIIEIEESLTEPTENEQIEQSLIGPETTTETLDQFDYKSASVLPMYEQNGETYFIVAREAYGWKSGVKGTYDDFGGAREPEDTDPLISAVREFFEEAILDKSLHLTFESACKLAHENTYLIIANTTRKGHKHVTYVINFKQYSNEFIHNFYAARKESTEYVNLEKDRVALIKLTDLKQVLEKNRSNNSSIYVDAQVLSRSSANRYHTEKIKLRPYFVIKLRGFFLDKPYKVSVENEKVRFYS